jgi:site-specific recombinase XerD
MHTACSGDNLKAVSKATKTITGPSLTDLHPSFVLSLRAARRSPRTVQSYSEALRQLDSFLRAAGMPTTVSSLTREHLESFIVDLTERFKPATAIVRFKSLQQFFRWAVEEGEIAISPMANMTTPKRQEAPVPVPSIDDVRKLLASCDPKTFEGRRDEAIIRVFADAGLRLAELTSLRTGDVDRFEGLVMVRGKGDKIRRVGFSSKTARALDRYMRLRARNPDAQVEALWLGRRGPMGTSGIAQMIERRSRDAGVENLHPHSLRHFAAHAWLDSGENENALMKLMGWSSRSMVDRYASTTAEDRALRAQRQAALGDRL